MANSGQSLYRICCSFLLFDLSHFRFGTLKHLIESRNCEMHCVAVYQVDMRLAVQNFSLALEQLDFRLSYLCEFDIRSHFAAKRTRPHVS